MDNLITFVTDKQIFLPFSTMALSRTARSYNKISTIYAVSYTHLKDFTDFIILDAIYRDAAKKDSPDVFVIFTGDAHFNLAIKYLRELKKKVIIYGVKRSLSNKLKSDVYKRQPENLFL